MKAIDLASEVNCPIVMSDEGPLPAGWMPLERGFEIFCISLEAIIRYAEPKGVRVAVELHNALTTRPEYLARLMARFGPGDLGINFDTGNFFLAGNDPVEALKPIAHRVIHVHAKEIPASHSTSEAMSRARASAWPWATESLISPASSPCWRRPASTEHWVWNAIRWSRPSKACRGCAR